jgi:hypothetical protein
MRSIGFDGEGLKSRWIRTRTRGTLGKIRETVSVALNTAVSVCGVGAHECVVFDPVDEHTWVSRSDLESLMLALLLV